MKLLRRTNLPTQLTLPNLRCPLLRLMNPQLRLNLLNRRRRLNPMNWQSPMNSLNCLMMRAAAPGRNCWHRAW